MLNLQDNNNKLIESLRMKDDEIFKLRQQNSDKQQIINKLRLENKKLQVSEKHNQHSKDNYELVNLKSQHEKKLSELQKDINYYKETTEYFILL